MPEITVILTKWRRQFCFNSGKTHKFSSLGLGIFDEVSVSKVMVPTTPLQARLWTGKSRVAAQKEEKR